LIAALRCKYVATPLAGTLIQLTNLPSMPGAAGGAAVEEIAIIFLLQLASTGEATPPAQTLPGSGCASDDFGLLARSSVQSWA
jgi:hypothetical protein